MDDLSDVHPAEKKKKKKIFQLATQLKPVKTNKIGWLKMIFRLINQNSQDKQFMY